MNILSCHHNLHSIVSLSGFISLRDMHMQVIPKILAPFRPAIFALEERTNPGYCDKSAIDTLGNTTAPALIIHSTDDNSVDFKRHFMKLRNALSHKENITFLELTGRVHNPTYTPEAVKYKQEFFKAHMKRVKRGKHKNKEDQRGFLQSYDWHKITEQDENVWEVIFEFLDK